MNHRFFIVAFLLSCGTASHGLAAQKLSRTEPILFEARELGYDTQRNLVVAVGNVEVVQGEYIVTADRITYSQVNNVVMAEGNVAVLEPSGHVYFAEAVELKDDLKRGVVENFRARLSDNSLFAAREARRINEDVTELDKAVYSPCKLCEDGGDPLWQIKANKVKVDEAEQRISYNDAFFEIYGVPIFYTPYFAHATPNADRKSGFMIPEYAQSSSLGTVVKTPYYVNIAPDKEATLTPIYTSKEGMVLQGEYRQLTDKGAYHLEGSVTNPSRRDALGNEIQGHDLRGHVRAKGTSKIDEVLSWGFNVNRTTDDTYLRRYNYSNEDTLISRLYLEGIQNRGYGVVQGLAFQGLELNDDPARSPLIFPLVDMEYETAPLWAGSRFRMSGNALMLERDIGSDTRRVAFGTGWRLPYITGGGHVFELDTSFRGDFYSVNDVDLDGGGLFDGTVTRLLPQLAASWRYPLVKAFESSSLIIEPIVQFVASPYGSNDDKIPNEDNEAPEFSDANLFSDDHYPGHDLVESGPRMNYGLRSEWQLAGGQNIYGLFGQNYTMDEDNRFPFTNELGDGWSDYVGRVGIEYLPVNLSYHFRLDRDDLTPHRNEVSALYMQRPLNLAINYISLDDDPYQNDKHEVAAGMGLNLNENWTFTLGGRRDLSDDGGMVEARSGLIFQNECITLLTMLNRQFTRDRDVEPSTSVSVRVSLKNLN